MIGKRAVMVNFNYQFNWIEKCPVDQQSRPLRVSVRTFPEGITMGGIPV
jgi:hypothetical protein